MMTKETILKKHFGYTAFRPGQESIIEALLQGKDAMAIMPTGAGKSICYQVPAMAMEGMTIVVSPLISLMKDQVASLTEAGIPAAFLNSSQDEEEALSTLSGIRRGRYKLIYVAPERLLLPGFLSMCQSLEISMVAVDEAHCVSQWGQDFRPSYLSIAPFIEALPQRPITCAFTATATDKVRDDVIRILKLQEPFTITTGFDRPNLTLHTSQPESRKEELFSILLRHRRDSGIVYCSTRKTVEDLCDKLLDQGFKATRYHAGLSDEERKENQDAFINDDCPIMVATNAFGMGIDKSNVRFVIHYNMPKCLESYYQEAGRAGRDGLPSDCYLFYNPQDVYTCRWFIENSENDQLTEEQKQVVKEQDHRRLKAMIHYAKTETCLRETLLAYFGEKAPKNCGNCSSCLKNYRQVDATEDARKALSCIYRNDGALGLAAVTAILKGQVPEAMASMNLESQTTFGLLKDYPEKKIRDLLKALIDAGYAQAGDDKYALLSIKDLEGTRQLFKNQRSFLMQQLREPVLAPAKAKPLSRSESIDQKLLYRLQEWRKAQAAREKQPAYIIFSDAVLRQIAEKKPASRKELLELSGIGERKAEKYGDAVIMLVLEFKKPGNLPARLKNIQPGTALTHRQRGLMICVRTEGSVIFFKEPSTGKVFKYRLDKSLEKLFVL